MTSCLEQRGPNFRTLCQNGPVGQDILHHQTLVGGIPTSLKNMSSSVGMMTFPIYIHIYIYIYIYGTNSPFMFQTTNQNYIKQRQQQIKRICQPIKLPGLQTPGQNCAPAALMGRKGGYGYPTW